MVETEYSVYVSQSSKNEVERYARFEYISCPDEEALLLQKRRETNFVVEDDEGSDVINQAMAPPPPFCAWQFMNVEHSINTL